MAEEKMSNLTIRITSAVVMIALAALAIYVGSWLFALVVAVISLGLAREYCNIVEKKGFTPNFYLVGLCSVAVTLLHYFIFWKMIEDGAKIGNLEDLVCFITMLIDLAVLLITFFSAALDNIFRFPKHNSALADSALSLMGVFYCGVMPGTLLNLRYVDSYLVIFVVAICIVTDVGAYFVGKSLGQAKLAPHVSPGKTWAGFWGAIFFTILLGLTWNYFRELNNPLLWSFLALGGSLVAQVGDLFESSLKRDAQVKDSGNCIPGHGGVLDRFDSYIFVSVYVYIFTLILNLGS